MALEQYKTQVLLLHSEQSTLDTLGAGFSDSDKYSVHFATTGTEALNTLGETPIHVLVSAQDLPGMSGLEALREARKRSPDTVGILLAGSDRDDGLEALVGDKEVFQIVRGAIGPDALLNIIDTATKRVRILAIAESANDTAADVDESAPETGDEHIVMETAENGSAIVSDGTGRLPVMKPEKFQVSPESSGREVDILVVSKDEEFLQTIKDSSRGMHNVHHANTAGQAQEIVRHHRVGVLVTDAAIAGSKIQILTQALRRDVPRLVAVVAGRRDDGELLMDLINQGQVYRFLLKPVSPGRARLAIEASIKHHLEAPETAFKGQAPRAAVVTALSTAAHPSAAETTPAVADQTGDSPERHAPYLDSVIVDDAITAGSTLSDAIPPDDDTPDREGISKLPFVGAATAAVLLLAAGFWMFSGRSSDDLPGPAANTDEEAIEAGSRATPAVTGSDLPAASAPVESAPPQPAFDAAYVALLDDARFARDAGRIVAPSGDNAVEYYVAARAAAPDNEVIAEELSALVNQVLTMAESALLDKRAADADTAIGMVALADADNPRLGFLNAQLSQIQLRATLDEARAAMREARFEDAGSLLTRAVSFAGDDTAELESLEEELANARSAQQIDEVLALANDRLAADQLTSPSNDNARYYFELALGNDPGNMSAQQGLDVIAGKLVLRARDAIDSGNLDTATALLDEARALDAESTDLEASAAALDNARERQAAAERQAAIARQEAARQAEAERQAELKRRNAASATLSNTAVAASEGALPGNDVDANAARTAGDKTGIPARPNGARSLTAGSSRTSGSNGNAKSAAPRDRADAGSSGAAGSADAGGSSDTVAISQLVRVNYVSPDYPRSAQRRNLSGWVDVSFTVSARGTVTDISVIDSTPGSVFNDAATDAVAQWRFEPVVENGIAVSKRAAVRMAFSLE